MGQGPNLATLTLALPLIKIFHVLHPLSHNGIAMILLILIVNTHDNKLRSKHT